MNWRFWKTKQIESSATSSHDEKVKQGIDFVIQKYGQTLKDLARYDRGESISR